MVIKKEDMIKKTIAVLLAFLLLLSAVFVYTAWRGGHFESAEAMRGYLEKFGIWGPVVLAMIQALQGRAYAAGIIRIHRGIGSVRSVQRFRRQLYRRKRRVADVLLARETLRSKPC